MSKDRAFPMRADVEYNHGGMYLRDYFAAKAMAVLLHPDMPTQVIRQMFNTASVPDAAYQIADEMMRAREVKTPWRQA